MPQVHVCLRIYSQYIIWIKVSKRQDPVGDLSKLASYKLLAREAAQICHPQCTSDFKNEIR